MKKGQKGFHLKDLELGDLFNTHYELESTPIVWEVLSVPEGEVALFNCQVFSGYSSTYKLGEHEGFVAVYESNYTYEGNSIQITLMDW
jgi:hypothetical protein